MWNRDNSFGIRNVGWCLALILFLPLSCAGADDPLNIGHNKQLFIDDYIIESLDGVSKKLNQPRKYRGNPVLPMVPKGESSWEAGGLMCFTTIFFDEDEKLYRMWYSLYEEGQVEAHAVLAYATSRDGIRWQKPSLGIVNYRGTSDNNIIMDHDGLECGIYKDPHETDPAKGYKMLYPNVRAAYSADGLRWTDYNEGRRVIFHAPGHDSQAVPYWDEGLGKYVAIIRDRTGMIKDVRKRQVTDPWARKAYGKLWGGPKEDRVPENHSLRRVGQVESEDFVHWTPMRTVVAADDDDPLHRDQFYNMQVMQYEGLRVGLMTVFSYFEDRERPRPRGAVQLTYSRDGMNWHRGGDREVFLPMSDRPGDFDWGFVWPVQGPLVVGDEIWIYYIGWNADHQHKLPPGVTKFNSGIGLAKLRLDGFVSLDAGPAGTATTKSFVFSGTKLLINADAKRGRVLVEILDETGKPISGFSKADCDALNEDKIRHTVTWQGKADLRTLTGKVIELKFYLTKAKLFTFRMSR